MLLLFWFHDIRPKHLNFSPSESIIILEECKIPLRYYTALKEDFEHLDISKLRCLSVKTKIYWNTNLPMRMKALIQIMLKRRFQMALYLPLPCRASNDIIPLKGEKRCDKNKSQFK